MASARAALGKARRGIIKRKKTTDVVTGALGAAATVTAFGAGQAKKAKTAWGEYEAGYKELGGDVADIKKPGFFKRTAQQILPGGKTGLPEGDVTIGKKIYDRGQIQKAGAFVGSDAAAMLDQPAIDRYMGRTAPGRTEATTFTQGISSQPLMSSDGQYATQGLQERIETGTGGIGVQGQNYVTSDLTSSRTGVYDQQGDIGFQGPDFLQGYQPDLQAAGSTITAADRKETARIQHKQSTGYRPSYSFPQGTPESKGFGGYRPDRGFTSYARGGDFITNGPQKIIVGDNPGGRERVTVKPLSPKDDESKYGRYGDDTMKMIDGKLAHINSILEKNMSPEDIKKYGAGTTNPITGKKEYFLGAITGALAIGSSLYKGYQATQNKGDVEAGQAAAGDIYQEQVSMLGEQKALATAATESQFTGAQRDVSMGTQMGIRDIQAGSATAASKSNLATSGTIEEQTKQQTGDLMAKYKSDMTKLVETRDLSRTEADLSYRKGEMSAEESYQATLTGLESQPTNFLEGMFS